jgi:hypothetical protein
MVIASLQQTWVPTSALGMETAKGPLEAGQPQLVVPVNPTVARGVVNINIYNQRAPWRALHSPVPVNATALPMSMAVEMAARRDLVKNMLLMINSIEEVN